MARNVAISVLRGVFANMPSLNDGEFYLATDQAQLYVGLGGAALPVGGIMALQIADKTTTSQLLAVEPDGSLLVNTAATKTAVLKTGTLTTVATTANQTILTYTVTVGKVFYLQYIDIQARLTAVSATAAIVGAVIINIGGVTVYNATFVNPTSSDSGSQSIRLLFSEPIPISSATVINIQTTPAAATSTLWIGNFGGFER